MEIDALVVRAGWKMMGSGLQWEALDVTAEVIGVDDPDVWIAGLTTIRDWFEAKHRADLARERGSTR